MGTSALSSTISEMHRRRVFRVATVYALVSWVLLQLGEITFDPLQLPPWSLTALIIVVLLGFPVCMALAWTFDLTADGIRRTEALADSGGHRAVLLLLGVLVLDGVVGYYLYTIYAPAVRNDAATETAATLAATAPVPEERLPNSIAVLPFDDLSEAQNQSYFADGISEELLNVLARIDGLAVAARTSSFAFRDQDLDIRDVGRALNVEKVLEGSIRRQGDRIRVTAQLIDARTGVHLWSNTYDRDVDDVFAIQDDLARRIADEMLEGGYEGFAAREQAKAAPASFAAYDRYLEGRALWRQRTPAALEKAIGVFQRTIELDPAFAPAYSGLADAYLLLASYGNLSLTDAVRQAQPLIQTALELDGQLSEGFASLGLLYRTLGRLGAGEAHLRRAIELDPGNLVAYVWLGGLLGQRGELGEQYVVLQQALERDPMDLLLNLNLAGNLLARGEVDEGFGRLEQVREIYPTSTLLLRSLAEAEYQFGRFDAAMGHARLALDLAPEEPPNQALMTQLLLAIGALEPARTVLDRALAVGGENGWVQDSHLRYLIMANRRDEARSLAEGLLERSGQELATGKDKVMPLYWLARLAMIEGTPVEASQRLELVLEETDSLPADFIIDVLTWKAAAHQRQGDGAGAAELLTEADRRLRRLKLQGVVGPGVLYIEGVIAALRGEVEQSVSLLSQAVERGWLDTWEAHHDQRLAGLRDSADFARWLEQVDDRTELRLASVQSRQLAAR